MVEGRRTPQHVTAGAGQGEQAVAHRPVEQAIVAAVGDDDLDAGAAQRGQRQCGGQGVVGQEIRGDDADAVPGGGDGGHHQQLDALDVVIWPGGGDAGKGVAGGGAGRGERREPERAAQGFAGGEGPILGEGGHHLANDRAAQAKMRVADATAAAHQASAAGDIEVLVADIHAAGEADAAIDDQQLLVRAQVEQRHAPGQVRMQEAGDRHRRAAQVAIGAGVEIATADTVQQHAHRNPARLGGGQRGDEAAADAVMAKDVAAERNAVPGGGDGIEHGGIGGLAVLQGRGGVAGQQGAAGDFAGGAIQRDQVRRRNGATGRLIGRGDGTAAQALAAALNAVDAEQDIQRGAECRGEPGQADPRGRGDRIALTQQDVCGHGRRAQDLNDGERSPERACVRYHSGRQAKGKNLLFVNKKKQKNFIHLDRAFAIDTTPMDKSFLVLFFKKERLSCFSSFTPCANSRTAAARRAGCR